jgi:hypothetical protein
MKTVPVKLLFLIGVGSVSVAQTNTFPTTGSVGIGTTNPGFKLEVKDAVAGVGMSIADTNNNSLARIRGLGIAGSQRGALELFSGGILTSAIYSDGNISFINGGGFFGIGTTNPGFKLEVKDTVAGVGMSIADTNNNSLARIRGLGIAGSQRGALELFSGGILTSAIYSDGNISFINGGGFFGIGTANPGFKLEVKDAVAGVGMSIVDANNNSLARIRGLGIAGSQRGALELYNGGTLTTAIYSDGNSSFITGGGNVGIGTALPGVKLSVADSQATVPAEILLYNLNNTGSRNVDLRLGNGSGQASVYLNNATLALGFGIGVPTGGLSYKDPGNYPGSDTLTLSTASSGNIVFSPNGTGNVGIGTTNPAQKLSVNGSIRAHEVIVDTGWSDYVFAADYALAPLSEVEAHIKAHHTLPGVPSASEVADQGIRVGDMQAKLLAKIEELTLHQIDQEKQITSLKGEVRSLQTTRP